MEYKISNRLIRYQIYLVDTNGNCNFADLQFLFLFLLNRQSKFSKYFDNWNRNWNRTELNRAYILIFNKIFTFHVDDVVSKFCWSISVTIHDQLWSFPKFPIGIVTSQYHDHYDIIIYPLINKRFLFKKFSNQLALISFCLLDLNIYSSIFTEVC